MAASPSHTLTRQAPRISANELARFMVSGDTGRVGIIRRARESTTPQRVRYKDARKALRTALCDAASEKRIIAAAVSGLEQRAEDSSSTISQKLQNKGLSH